MPVDMWLILYEHLSKIWDPYINLLTILSITIKKRCATQSVTQDQVWELEEILTVVRRTLIAFMATIIRETGYYYNITITWRQKGRVHGWGEMGWARFFVTVQLKLKYCFSSLTTRSLAELRWPGLSSHSHCRRTWSNPSRATRCTTASSTFTTSRTRRSTSRWAMLIFRLFDITRWKTTLIQATEILGRLMGEGVPWDRKSVV